MREDPLSPLPERVRIDPEHSSFAALGYTADQMRAYAAEAVAAERERWERALGAEMPADFKCWHQNAASERPEVAAWVIRNLRERETLAWRDALAWSEGQRAALDCRTCNPGPTDEEGEP